MARLDICHWVLLVTVGGCAHRDSLTADQHRAAAAAQQHEARLDQERYVPGAKAVALTGEYKAYNPTADYLRLAEQHQRVAHAHSEAAAQIEHFEDDACVPLSQEARAACPLFSGGIERVEETIWGVRLHLKKGTDGAELIARMRCHLAFTRTHGYQDRPACLLYYRGVGVDLVGLGEVIEVRATEASTAGEIRQDAQEPLVPRTDVRR